MSKLDAEIGMVFHTAISDIDRAKQWQWQIFLNVMTAQGAMFALFSLFSAQLPSVILRATLAGCSVLLFILGSYNVQAVQRRLHAYRKTVVECRFHFENRTNAIISGSDAGRPASGMEAPPYSPDQSPPKSRIHLAFHLSLGVATLIVCALILTAPVP